MSRERDVRARRRGLLPILVASAILTAGAGSFSRAPSVGDASPPAVDRGQPAASPAGSPAAPNGWCDNPEAWIERATVPGETAMIHATDFPPGTLATVTVMGSVPTVAASMDIDETGTGVASFLVPTDTAFGRYQVNVEVPGQCISYTFLDIVPSRWGISIDDRTVLPGQRVTVTASGFGVRAWVHADLDCDPIDGPVPCDDLATRRADGSGSVALVVRIPRGTSPGRHKLQLWGYDYAGDDVDLWAPIRVLRTPDLPPTDAS